MLESESSALTIWRHPYIFQAGRGSRIRTYAYQSQSLMPYRLAIPLYFVSGVSRGIRTLGLKSHNLAL